MRLGVWLPIVNLNPSYGAADWERTGGIEDIAAVAAAAETAGVEFVCSPEHVALPEARYETRGGRYWDPLSTLGFVAARTRRIGLVPLVIVLGYHHPLAIAKRIGTLDVVSAGRVTLGVGVGTLEEEFALLDAPFADRGRRADDSMQALRAALGQRAPAYDGAYHKFAGMIVEPGLRADMKLWVGGRTRPSLRRALRFADAWAPFNLNSAQIAALLIEPEMRKLREAREGPFEVVQTWGGTETQKLDPVGDPGGARAVLRACAADGVAAIVPYLVNRSRAHHIEQIGALAELARTT